MTDKKSEPTKIADEDLDSAQGGATLRVNKNMTLNKIQKPTSFTSKVGFDPQPEPPKEFKTKI
ncbi:MAG: hypothetical protein AAGH74_14755 [Pseudomonadota bacterium]